MTDDPVWLVRSEAASALGEVDNKNALDVLLDGLDQDDARVRNVVVQALGTIDKDASRKALVEVVSDEPSPYVVASSIRALGKMKAQEARRPISRALSRGSHGEVIRRAALDALAALEEEDSLKTIAAYCSAGKPRQSRRTAISAVGRLGKWMDDKDKPRATLVKLLRDPLRQIRTAAMDALGELGDPKSLADLERAAEIAKNPDEKRRAKQAVEKINGAREQTPEVRQLRKKVDQLEKTGREMQERLKTIESRIDAMKEQRGKKDKDTSTDEEQPAA